MRDLKADIATLREAGILEAVDARFASALGRLAGVADDEVLLGAALACRAPRYGHVAVDLEALAQSLRREDGAGAEAFIWPEAAPWAERIAASSLAQGDGAPLVVEDRRVYLRRYHEDEVRLAEMLKARAATRPDGVDENALQRALERYFPADENEPENLRRRAARMAAEHCLAVISGGPGTGKTSSVVRILALLGELLRGSGRPLRARLLAPTGKAAARLGETVRAAKRARAIPIPEEILPLLPEEAQTVHRALGTAPESRGRFLHGADHPLAADIVVVDEASMVDLPLMRRLVEAVPPSARLILLGDRDQLASVEAGAVLGDLFAAGQRGPLGACLTHLTRSLRFAEDSGIRALARAIQEQDTPRAMEILHGGLRDVEWVEFDGEAGFARALRERLVQSFRPAVMERDPQRALENLSRFRVLTAHRRGRLGAAGLNALIESWLAAAGLAHQDREYAGRPVLVGANDYGAGLFNGDMGVLLPEPENAGWNAVFQGRMSDPPRKFAPARLPSPETAWAMTIHKSQGSEFAEVLAVMDRPSPILTRELLYTALTRASRKVTLACPRAALASALAQRVSRTSGLAKRLSG